VIGDNRYWRANYQYQQYVPLNKQYTVAFNGELGWGKGLNGQPFPVFKNFYSGGLGSVRGFEQRHAGPARHHRRLGRRHPQGHAQRRAVHAVPRRRQRPHAAPVRVHDVGNVYGENDRLRLNEMRASVGRRHLLAVSPIGPLRFAWPSPSARLAIESSDCNSRSERPSDEVPDPSFPVGPR
jgi:outer membrane protein insertion porin family